MSKSILFIFVIFSIQVIHASSDSAVSRLTDVDGRYREHNVDYERINLDVKFIPREGKVIGRETLTFTAIQPTIDSLFLDAPRIIVSKVLLDKATTNVSYTSAKDGIIIRFNTKPLRWEERHTLSLEYEATPRKGLYFIGWNDEKNLSRKQIWTQGQGVDNRYWFPCYDDVNDKVITETTITFDKAYTVVSNGNLVDTKLNADSTKTWHYAMTKPHSPYLVMMAIDKYAYHDYKSENGITSRQYYYADHPECEAPTYQYSKEMMDWLPREIGVPFAWQSYSNSPVQDFMFGAMENTTATIFGDFMLQDARANIERGYVGVNAHELTHQWFGDYITEWSGTHHWLHESFATYYSKMFMRHIRGEDYYEWAKRGEALTAINADKENRYPVAHSKGGNARHYPKGSFVIGMLRYVVGDAVYRKTIAQYLKKHAHGMVDTHDFYRAFQETAGINLDWFFDQWIFHSGVPNYDIHYVAGADKTTFYLAQTHGTDSLIHLFKMPLVFEVHYTDGSRDTVRKMVSEKYDTISLSNPAKKSIAYTLFDPGYQVLKTVSFAKSYPELLTQASKARHLNDRYEAIYALRDTPLSRKVADLSRLYNELVPNTNTSSEIIYQLKGDTSTTGYLIQNSAIQSSDMLTRRAVIEYTEPISSKLLPFCQRLLKDTSYVTIEMTLKKLVKQFPENKSTYLALTDGVMGISKNVRIAWLEIKATDSLDPYKTELIDYGSHSYEFRTRVKAFEALERLRYCDEAVVRNLFDAMINPNTRLAGPAEKTLKALIKKQQNKDLATDYLKKNIWKDWQLEKLQKGLEGQ